MHFRTKLGKLLHSEVLLGSSLDREIELYRYILFCRTESCELPDCGISYLSEGVIKIKYKGNTLKILWSFKLQNPPCQLYNKWNNEYKMLTLLCGRTFPGETQCTCLLTPDREPTRDQRTDTTKLGDPMRCFFFPFVFVFLQLLTGIQVRGHFQGQKWLRDSCVTEAHSSVGDKAWKLGTWSTSHSLQAS